MAIHTYKCNECGFSNEYIESISVSPTMWHPEKCPECKTGKMEKVFDMAGHSIGIDFVGPGFYTNDWGIHAWKKRMSIDDQSKVLAGTKNPY